MAHLKAAPIPPRDVRLFVITVDCFCKRKAGFCWRILNVYMCIKKLLLQISGFNLWERKHNIKKHDLFYQIFFLFFTAPQAKTRLQWLCWMSAACLPHASSWNHHSSAHLDPAVVRSSDYIREKSKRNLMDKRWWQDDNERINKKWDF